MIKTCTCGKIFRGWGDHEVAVRTGEVLMHVECCSSECQTQLFVLANATPALVQ